MTSIRVGDHAPAFTLQGPSGENVSLNSYLGKNVVLYFYPKDFTKGCTVEATAFRDNYESFKAMGAEVIGVSSDSPGTHRRFLESCNLPFTLVSDVDKMVRKLYGVPSTFWIIAGRVTYIIDKDGIVRHIFNSQSRPRKHVEEAIEVLRKLTDK